MRRLTHEGRRDAAVELLIVHQRDGLPALHRLQQLATAVRALGREKPNAIAGSGVPDQLVNVRVVGRAVGHLTDDASVHDGAGHHFPVGEMAGDEDDRSSRLADLFQTLPVDEFHAPATGLQLVHPGEFKRRSAKIIPLFARQFLPISFGHLRKCEL